MTNHRASFFKYYKGQICYWNLRVFQKTKSRNFSEHISVSQMTFLAREVLFILQLEHEIIPSISPGK